MSHNDIIIDSTYNDVFSILLFCIIISKQIILIIIMGNTASGPM